MTGRRKRIALAAALGLWAAAAAGGVGLLMASARVPDAPADTPADGTTDATTDARPSWPAGPAGVRHAGRATLVVCLHPRCPCSDATLDALAALVGLPAGATPDAFDTVVYFAAPDPARPAWSDTALVARARRLPGVTVVIDAGGRACAALGARASGQAFLYDPSGRLAFSGGLTPGRGESGATPGATLVARALADRRFPAATARADVFGCTLYRSPSQKAVP